MNSPLRGGAFRDRKQRKALPTERNDNVEVIRSGSSHEDS